ncbi:MAG: PIN domain-containing protein [Roseiarcus sp.]
MSRFFDTNVLVYAFLDGPKRMRAQQALAEGGIISAQVLNEFTHVSRRKHLRDWPEIEAALGVIRGRFPVVAPLTEQTHAAALALARDHGFAFYDALIVAAAIEAGCDTLVTEDMQHGRTIDALTICDPFRQSAS